MIYIYDEALIDKLKAWTENTSITILGPEETRRTFEIIGDETNDKSIKLPLVCLRRKGGYQITNINKKPLTYDGMLHEADFSNAVSANAIPISIQYQLDIYTRTMKEADVYARDFIFNLINHPTVKYIVPFNGFDKEFNATVRIDEEVADNSDIPERFFPGQMTRLSLNLNIDDAYLWSIPIRPILEMGLAGLEIHSSEKDITTEEIK